MYLTLNHPQMLEPLASMRSGLLATPMGLALKVSKEAILTAKVNAGFDFYLAPGSVGGRSSYVLVTTFFDVEDHPLALFTPLLRDDASTNGLIALMGQETFNAFLFDELGRELLSVEVAGPMPELAQKLSGVELLSVDEYRDALTQANDWFSRRSEDDDKQAVHVKIVSELLPSDLFVMDVRPDNHRFHGQKGFSATMLEREEPGAFQEQDIVFLLQRTFPPESIYLNPIKIVDEEELVDILVMGEYSNYLFTAKDSPNTERMLRNTIERKRSKSLAQMQGGANQIRGAFSQIARTPRLVLRIGEREFGVDLTGKKLLGVIVVKEIFMDTMQEYSRIVFDLMNEAGKNCVAFDYPELNEMTLHCPSEELFLGAVWQILEGAREYGELPRLRYSRRPPTRTK